jgi:GNAT superfamily N-acetyltransferase
MFVDSGQADSDAMCEMAANFVEWVRPRLEDGRYLGWLMEDEERVVAGAGMWLMDFPPHWMDAEARRAYLLNFYVEPEFRGRGLAEQMLKMTLDEARRRGIGVVSLHASKLGRRIYERNGFEGTNEMMLRGEGAEKKLHFRG